MELVPSLTAQTKQYMADRAHRRLLEEQDEHYLDTAGLAVHRRLPHRVRRSQRVRERLMQAGL